MYDYCIGVIIIGYTRLETGVWKEGGICQDFARFYQEILLHFTLPPHP